MTRQSWQALARLGLPALPLAFVALPLYMVWPHHVATNFGVSLGLLGGLLWGLKRMQAGVRLSGGVRQLEVIEAVSVGPRQ